jgi:hypothetical protein
MEVAPASKQFSSSSLNDLKAGKKKRKKEKKKRVRARTVAGGNERW